MNAGIVVFVVLIVLSFIGVPVYLSIAFGTITAMIVGGIPLEALLQKSFLGLNSSAMLSIPFFILAGNLMSQGITQKLINVANAVLGRVKGSLGAITILASALFGAISGSAVATVAAVGGMTIPAMKEQKYDENYAVAVSSAASLLGPMIPPSISLIIYASLTETSVRRLFMATAVPAIVCTLLFLVYALYYGKKMDLPTQPKQSAKEIVHVFIDSFWALLMPIIVLGSIFTGICTVTESAAISVIYAAVVSLFIYRTMTFKKFLSVLFNSSVSIAAIMILVAFSKAASYVVVSSQLPQAVVGVMSGLIHSRIMILLFINIIFLILGCLMDGNSIIVMMVPLMLELVKSYDINLIQFGIITCVNIYIGCITPPVGVSLLLGTKLGKTEMGKTMKAMLPFMAISFIILILVTYVPIFSLWLPSLVS